MDLRKLQIFVAVAQRGSFSAAAEQLHMAQPAVSIAVRKLEQSLELALFDRSAKHTVLTAEGRTLLVQAKNILKQVEDLQYSAGALKGLLQGELNIACPAMLATYFLPEILSDFLDKHPGLTASVIQAGTHSVEELLRQDEIEIGVTIAEPSRPADDVEIIPLVKEEMVICVAQDHPWAQRQRLKIQDLHRAPMVVYQDSYFIRGKLDALCLEHGVEPELRMESNFLPLLARMVKQGLGVTVGLNVMAEQEPGIVGIPLTPKTQVPMAIAKRRGRVISRANQAFLNWLPTAL